MWLSFLGLFVFAFTASLFLTPFIGILANKLRIVDVPGGRHLHDRVVPKLGGVAIFLSFILVVLVTHRPTLTEWTVLGVGLIFLLIGVLDDAYRITPWSKLLGQLAAAIVLVMGGLEITTVANPFTGSTIPPLVSLGTFSALITVLWIVGLANTVNLSDGVDGLVSGVTCISAIILALLSIKTDNYPAAQMAVIFTGAVAAFLVYNFHPAKIFLGDSGTMFIGYFLAALGFLGGAKLATALLVLGVPILDGGFTIVYRLLNGKPVYIGDRNHLHFRLLKQGLSPVQVCFIFYGLSCFFGVLALFISGRQKLWALGLLFVIFLIGWISLYYLDRRRK
ncbi:MAG TPA: MraY family glycosyltransferase [bacterium]|nr:MraY family glycosyltransferase [bacterium]